jgi:hypothetical protein
LPALDKPVSGVIGDPEPPAPTVISIVAPGASVIVIAEALNGEGPKPDALYPPAPPPPPMLAPAPPPATTKKFKGVDINNSGHVPCCLA